MKKSLFISLGLLLLCAPDVVALPSRAPGVLCSRRAKRVAKFSPHLLVHRFCDWVMDAWDTRGRSVAKDILMAAGVPVRYRCQDALTGERFDLAFTERAPHDPQYDNRTDGTFTRLVTRDNVLGWEEYHPLCTVCNSYRLRDEDCGYTIAAPTEGVGEEGLLRVERFEPDADIPLMVGRAADMFAVGNVGARAAAGGAGSVSDSDYSDDD